MLIRNIIEYNIFRTNKGLYECLDNWVNSKYEEVENIDLYTVCLIFDLLSFIVFVFGYTSFQPDVSLIKSVSYRECVS